MTFMWDEISCEITVGPIVSPPEGWERKPDYPNGVRRFESDRGHVALECEADDRDQADDKFAEFCEEYAETMRGY